MEIKEMICIGCPKGCNLIVKVDGEKISVSGNNCPYGDKYAKNEIISPMRVLTSTIDVINGKRVSCKTSKPILKNKLFTCMKQIRKTKVLAPIKIGDILIKNIDGNGTDIIATKNID